MPFSLLQLRGHGELAADLATKHSAEVDLTLSDISMPPEPERP